MANAVRIKTSTGWQDLAVVGPAGADGAVEVYEQPTAPVGATEGALWIDTDETLPSYEPLPDAAGNEGKWLKSSSGSAIWDALPSDLPLMTGQNGKWLTVSGGAAAWADLAPMADDQRPVEKRGSGGTNVSFTAPAELYGAAVPDLRHAITPTRNVWWKLEAQALVKILDAAWYRIDGWWAYDAGPADALGKTTGSRCARICHNALDWTSMDAQAVMKCQAGVAYAVRPIVQAVNGTGQWHTAHDYLVSRSYVCGYW